jgi:hypothetical protein
MVPLAQLWLPILLSAVFIFVASSVIHMVLKWHNSEYRPFSNEDAVRTAVRAGAAAGPGQYVIPHIADMKQMKEAETRRKFEEGPVAFVTVRRSGQYNMGKPLVLWFLYTLGVSLIAGYLASRSMAAGAHASQIMRATSLVPLLAYIGGSIQHGIWMGKPGSSVAKEILDGMIYAGITGLTFAWLWPSAA